nr:hypothetical protein [Geodermatophilaceae bacterium]
ADDRAADDRAADDRAADDRAADDRAADDRTDNRADALRVPNGRYGDLHVGDPDPDPDLRVATPPL